MTSPVMGVIVSRVGPPGVATSLLVSRVCRAGSTAYRLAARGAVAVICVASPVRGGRQHDLDALELLDVGVSGRSHGLAQRPDDIGLAVSGAAGPEEDLLERGVNADLDPLAPGQRRGGGPRYPWQPLPGASVARARAAPSMTASEPQAIALTMSPEVPTPPSAMTWT